MSTASVHPGDLLTLAHRTARERRHVAEAERTHRLTRRHPLMALTASLGLGSTAPQRVTESRNQLADGLTAP